MKSTKPNHILQNLRIRVYEAMSNMHIRASAYHKPVKHARISTVAPSTTIVSWRKYSSGSVSLQWRHDRRDSVSNHQPHDCLLNRLFRRRSKKTSKLRVTGLCTGNSPVTGEFSAQMAGKAENVSIWWRHHVHITTKQEVLRFRIAQSGDVYFIES